jgi:peptidoglycan hydrolase CwlO-like protein
VAEKAKLETLKQRAELILQFERVMSTAERENPQYHPKYLHALVAADEVEDELGAEEAGVINGVKRLLVEKLGKNSLGDKVEEMQKAIETKISANDQKIEKIEEKVEKVEEKVDKMEEKLDGLKDDMAKDMAKIMALLEAMQPSSGQ